MAKITIDISQRMPRHEIPAVVEAVADDVEARDFPSRGVVSTVIDGDLWVSTYTVEGL